MMGCTCTSRYSVESGWITRERRVHCGDALASESLLARKIELPT